MIKSKDLKPQQNITQKHKQNMISLNFEYLIKYYILIILNSQHEWRRIRSKQLIQRLEEKKEKTETEFKFVSMQNIKGIVKYPHIKPNFTTHDIKCDQNGILSLTIA